VGPRWSGLLTYNADLFDHELIEQVSRHLVRVLEAMTAEPDRRIGSLALAEAPGRAPAGVAEAEAAGPTLHELFARQASATPDRVAVSCGEIHLRYQELDARANQLAHHLRRQGTRPGQLVGVCLDRAVELPIAILAVLKAGGAYLPLDPSDPVERLKRTIADAGIAQLVVAGPWRTRSATARSR
jgi:non-ribosomal peptide synthetase component F